MIEQKDEYQPLFNTLQKKAPILRVRQVLTPYMPISKSMLNLANAQERDRLSNVNTFVGPIRILTAL